MDNPAVAHPMIPIQPEPAQAPGCSACVHAERDTTCRGALGQECIAPMLVGPRAEIDRLMRALGEALGFRADAEAALPVTALRVEPGEVELTLNVAPHCGGASLVQRAFETLRGLLPDTDIYVACALP